MADQCNYMVYLNSRLNRVAESIYDRLTRKKVVRVPGNVLDKTDRGQPKRFDKWYKMPVTAHRLYWRFHKQ